MSKSNFWQKLDAQNAKQPNANTGGFWDKLDTQNVSHSQQKNPSLGDRVVSAGKDAVKSIASAHRSAASGVLGAIPDTAALAYNLPAIGVNYAISKGGLPLFKAKSIEEMTPPKDPYQLPLIPSATEAIGKGIDYITDDYTKPPKDQEHIHDAIKTGASFATGGALSTLAKEAGKKSLAKAGNFIGNTNPWQIGGAATAGGTMSYLNSKGASSGETIGGGLAANVAVNSLPNIATGGGNFLAKGALTLAGLGKKQLNIEAAKAARDLDIALPKAAASEGKIIALVDQFLGKAPISGNIMQKRYLNMANKVTKELDSAYDSVINSKELVGIDDRIKRLYDNAKEVLPQEAQVIPQKTTTVTEEIRNKLAESASLSPGEKKVLSIIKDYEEIFTPYGIKRIPAPVKNLVASQDSLNKVIDWKDNNVNWLKEKKAASYVKELHNAISNDLSQYGKKNPEWYNYFKQADNLFSKKATREELQNMFTTVENTATGELSYNSLSKILHDDQTKNRLKKITQPEIFERLEKLGTVARAMAVKNKNLPNPSGTAATQATLNVLGLFAGVGSYAAGAGLPTAMTYIIGAPAIAHLLTDKKTLDLAIKFAETGGQKAALGFNNRMRAITGYTPVTLMREASKLEQEKQRTKQE